MGQTTTNEAQNPVTDSSGNAVRSPLDVLVREDARKMLQAALESEVQDFLEQHAARVDDQGRRLVVRNGHLPTREIVTGAGPLEIAQPRVRDKSPEVAERVRFSLSILPPYLRQSRSMEELIPWLYLIHEIWQAETRAMGNQAFDHFLEKYGAKYPDACECLKKDREALLTFYDFPAEHWGHLRTTNPIESTFATIRLRHRKTKGNGTRRASLTMMFKLAQTAQSRWRRLNGHQLITRLIEGRIFIDGILQLAA